MDGHATQEKKLGKLDSCFDMKIEADTKAIRSKETYLTSSTKRKIIKQFVQDALDRNIIHPSNSEISLPVIVIMEKGKPQFYIDLKEVNANPYRQIHAPTSRFGLLGPEWLLSLLHNQLQLWLPLDGSTQR